MTISLGLAAAGNIAGCKGKDAKPDTPEPAASSAREAVPPAADKPGMSLPPAPPIPPAPLGIPAAVSAADKAITAEQVELGELLFFDTRLSDGGSFACVTCHVPEKGWTDGLVLSPKADGKVNTRHSPTMYNVGFATAWYWDGRKDTLEGQILAAWTGQVGGTPDKVAATLAEIPAYKARFERAFAGQGPTADNIPKALGAFLRVGVRLGDTPWDRYEAGDKTAVSEDAVAGYQVFTKKAGCVACHAPPLFTDMNFHNVGVGYQGVDTPDEGRFAVSKEERDRGAFKTPGLRGVTLSGPYFHDGSAATLEEAVDFMIGGGYRKNNPTIDPLLRPVTLSADERAQLLAFIQSLSPAKNEYKQPTLP